MATLPDMERAAGTPVRSRPGSHRSITRRYTLRRLLLVALSMAAGVGASGCTVFSPPAPRRRLPVVLAVSVPAGGPVSPQVDLLPREWREVEAMANRLAEER